MVIKDRLRATLFERLSDVVRQVVPVRLCPALGGRRWIGVNIGDNRENANAIDGIRCSAVRAAVLRRAQSRVLPVGLRLGADPVSNLCAMARWRWAKLSPTGMEISSSCGKDFDALVAAET
jgi:hypothetical protein